jgi:hypothetical protein
MLPNRFYALISGSVYRGGGAKVKISVYKMKGNFSKIVYFSPDSRPKAVLHMAPYSPRKSIRKSPKSDSAVSMRPRKLKCFVRVPR